MVGVIRVLGADAIHGRYDLVVEGVHVKQFTNALSAAKCTAAVHHEVPYNHICTHTYTQTDIHTHTHTHTSTYGDI